jgi:hypothetical protein
LFQQRRIRAAAVKKREGAAGTISRAPFRQPVILKAKGEGGYATGATLTSLLASFEIAGTLPSETSTDETGRRRGVRDMFAEKTPDGVSKSVVSRCSALLGRRARTAQKSIQAKSTPRSVQVRNISVNGFMGTSFLDIT